MAYRDLREFLCRLEEEGQLIHFHDEVLPEPHVRAIGRAAADMVDTGPAVLLDNIKGYRGKKLALNVHGTWANYAVSMGMPKKTTVKEMFYELARRWELHPGEVKTVSIRPARRMWSEKTSTSMKCCRCSR